MSDRQKQQKRQARKRVGPKRKAPTAAALRRMDRGVDRSEAKTVDGLITKLVYMPRDLVKRIKREAIDRDESMRDTPDDLLAEAGMVAIRGDSGVIVQIVRNYFADLDTR